MEKFHYKSSFLVDFFPNQNQILVIQVQMEKWTETNFPSGLKFFSLFFLKGKNEKNWSFSFSRRFDRIWNVNKSTRLRKNNMKISHLTFFFFFSLFFFRNSSGIVWRIIWKHLEKTLKYAYCITVHPCTNVIILAYFSSLFIRLFEICHV